MNRESTPGDGLKRRDEASGTATATGVGVVWRGGCERREQKSARPRSRRLTRDTGSEGEWPGSNGTGFSGPR